MWPAFILVVSLIAIYIISYVLNKKTPIPEGCEMEIDKVNCNACNNHTCSIKDRLEE